MADVESALTPTFEDPSAWTSSSAPARPRRASRSLRGRASDEGFLPGYEHELIELIYESALIPTKVPALLAALRRASESNYAAWLRQDTASGEIQVVSSSESGDFTVECRSAHRIPRGATERSPGTWVVSGYTCAPAIFDLGACVDRDSKVSDHVVIARCGTRVQYGPRERVEFAKTTHHLARALDLRRAQRERERRGLFALSALQSASIAVCVIDSTREIRYQSALAEKFIARGSPLREVFRRLEITDPTLRTRLEPLLRAALDHAAANVGCQGGAVWHIKRDLEPQRLSVFPVNNPGIDCGPLAALLIEPAARNRDGLIEAFAIAHGLSRTETRLTRLLCEGADLKSAAQQLGQQLSTTRTVLKSIFAKTDTHRQSELVAAVLLSS